MEQSGTKSKLLPENAYRPLKEGEVYKSVVPADQSPPETTIRAIIMGCIGVVIFTFAAAYIGLKAGNVIETAIPIAILAVFFGKMFPRKNHLLENVIVQSIGAAAGVVVAGAVFTIPAMYILGLEPNFLDIFLACSIGGFLGILLIIPLRRYFCKDEHGNLPFPEATATTEILCSGEAGGGGGKTLLTAFGLGFIFDFCIEVFHAWEGKLESARVLLGQFGANMNEKLRMALELEAIAALFGLGYIIGIRYAAVICAGSVLANLVLVPMIFYAGEGLTQILSPATDKLISEMTAAEIFTTYVRPIGIGAIAMAGMISIIKMGKIILGSLSLGFKGIFGGSAAEAGAAPRTDRDILPRNVMLLELLFVVGMFFIFFYVADWQFNVAIIGTLVTAALAFLFTPVAARAIAIVGVNPVSGMTMITLIIACTILATTGLSGPAGQMTVLIIGCAVCTALSTSGAFISDLKIGYWLGATPRRQQCWKFLGIIVAAICVGFVIDVLAKGNGFVLSPEHPNPLPAPQGNLMKTIVETTLVPDAQPPWLLYGFGAFIAVMLEMTALPGLAFALGIYLPMYINLPVLAGGFAAWLLARRGRTDREKGARKNQGILVASGLVAGAAIAGVFSAIIKTIDQKDIKFGFIDMEGTNGAINRAVNLSTDFTQQADGTWLSTERGWFEHYGPIVGLIALILLGVLCHFIAARAANKQIEAEDAAE
ncbi:MAG: OPT family oligopeptide transporter [Planctomycetota bacterium]|jgi:putative OPT family oligopeptide transporter